MDFAVTSPLQQSVLASAAETQLAAASEYEQRKYNDRDTAANCQRFGLKLAPMVVESFGGWGQQAQETFKGIASELAAQRKDSGPDVPGIQHNPYASERSCFADPGSWSWSGGFGASQCCVRVPVGRVSHCCRHVGRWLP